MAKRDVPLDVPTVLSMLEQSTFWFGRSCRRLPASVIRGVLAATVEGAPHLFLRLAVPVDVHDAELAQLWHRAVEALLDLDLTYAWGSKPRRAKFRALADDPHMLQAIQGAAAHSKEIRLDFLAVLVIDGSDASFDALVPHVDPAFVHQDIRLDRLERLRTHAARTPALEALFAEIDGALEARNAVSPALALGPIIGVGALPVFWFDASLESAEQTSGRVGRIQGHVAVDSRAPRWFRVSIGLVHPDLNVSRTSFDSDPEHTTDELELGRCEPAHLPAWLAGVARQRAFTWQVPHIRSHLRGAKRDRIAAWLRGGER